MYKRQVHDYSDGGLGIKINGDAQVLEGQNARLLLKRGQQEYAFPDVYKRQGFAMLLAVANNDRPAFDKLWQWTDNTLRNKSNGLFYAYDRLRKTVVAHVFGERTMATLGRLMSLRCV